MQTCLLNMNFYNFISFFLWLLFQTELGLDYKDCLIIKNEHYTLPGVQKSFSSLKELTSYYQVNMLLLAEIPVKLARCCPPRPKGIAPPPRHLAYSCQLSEILLFLQVKCYFTLSFNMQSQLTTSAKSCLDQIQPNWLGILYNIFFFSEFIILIYFHFLKKHFLVLSAFKELTNLIIVRNSSAVEAQGSPTPDRNKFSHIQFQMIKYEDLKWVSVSVCRHCISTSKYTKLKKTVCRNIDF